MNLKNLRVLVTGSSGFIGSNLIPRLENLGAKVEKFTKTSRCDILNERLVISTVKKKYDVIYHLAGFSGGEESNRNIEKTFQINTLATLNLINAVADYSHETKLILSSSRLEYGTPIYLPVDESHPTVPTSAYGLSKLAATQIALAYNRTKNLKVTIFRTSNVYGPHKDIKFQGYNVINHFIDQAKKGRVLRIFGDGRQERDYIYVDDLIEAFLLSLSQKAEGKIYNLGYGQNIQFKDMAILIVKIVGKGRVIFESWPKNYKQVETGSYISDISKIQKDLGFTPKVGFELGITKTIDEVHG